MKNTIKSVLVIALLFATVPGFVSAISVQLETAKKTIAVGDTAVVTIKVSSEGVVYNTIEGNVVLNGGVAVSEFSLANSAFGLWPRTPSLSEEGRVVSFVGGVPGGFDINGATLFKIIVQAREEGVAKITPEDFAAYVNDGKGTKVSMKGKGVELQVVKSTSATPNDEWQNIISADKKAPEDFIVVLGQDQNLFEGKKFAFFSAIDNQSGISHYEVSENDTDAVRSGSTYVLQDQENDVELHVTAIDKAGNKKVAEFSSAEGFFTNVSWGFVAIVVLIILVLYVLFKRRRVNKTDVTTSI